MAEIVKATGYTPANFVSTVPVPGVSLATKNPGNEHQIAGKVAGEAIAAGDACYIKQSDGKIYRSTGAAANAAAVVDGFAADNASIGQPVTLFFSVLLNYSSGLLVTATSYYLSGTVVGGIADAASTGGTTVIARSMDTNIIYCKKSY